MVHSWVPLHSFYLASNPPSWSVSTVFGFCVLFPLLAWRLDRNWPVKLGACLLVAAGVMFACHRGGLPHEAATGVTSNGLLFMSPLARAFEFCLGMATASLWRRHGPGLRLGRAGGTALELAAILVLGVNAYFARDLADGLVWRLGLLHPSRVWFFSGTTCVSSAALVFVSALGRGWITQALSWRGFVYLGNVSYTANLLHIPLLIWVSGHAEMFAACPRGAVFAGYLAAVVAVSAATWTWIEIPTRKFLLGLRPEPSAIPAPHARVGPREAAGASSPLVGREEATPAGWR